MSDVREFGAAGDGTRDDTDALRHALDKGDGQLVLPRGDYLITRPLVVRLPATGRVSVTGSGGLAKLIMAGPGPALHLVGTHDRTALPESVAAGVWQRQRFPTVSDLEIEGRHPQADGVRVEGAVQPTFRGLLVRRCRHAIHLTGRDRNVLIADCHLYDNAGVGVFLDRVNLHQVNINSSHISYCKQGGIRVAGSEVRNIQICGNDIEYNHDLKADASADVFFDCRQGTVREGTVVGNTIQAVDTPGGANIRLVGAGPDNPNAVGMLAITGNLIGSQRTLLHLQACRGVVVSGNSLYNGFHYAVHAEDCEHLVLGANGIDHNSDYKGKSADCVLLRRCRNVTLTGLMLQHTREAETEPAASVELSDCTNLSVTGCQVLNARTRGILLDRCSVARVADCTVRGRPGDRTYRAAVHARPGCSHLLVTNNFLGKGSEGDLLLPDDSGTASGNVTLG